jgi:hypothetical protein
MDVDGLRYEVRDVSISGVLVRPYAGGHQVGSSFSFRLHLRGETDTEVVIDGGAVVVRAAAGEMAAQFFHLDSDQFPAFDGYLERYAPPVTARHRPIH